MQEHATERGAGVRARWYVLVTSATGDSVFATMGPYPTEGSAKDAAVGAQLVRYRWEARPVGATDRGESPIRGLPALVGGRLASAGG